MTYAEAAKKQWSALVEAACNLPERGYEDALRSLAKEAGVTAGALKRKCDSIRFAAESMSREAIVLAGQGEILRRYMVKRRAVDEKKRKLICVIPASQFESIQNPQRSEDSEEPLLDRLQRVIGAKTWEDVWDFILATYSDLSDKDLQHLAGMDPQKKKR